MDEICCLLGLCCAQLQPRVEKVTAMFASWGVEPKDAEVVARGLITALDKSELGHFMRAVMKHADRH